MIKKEMSINKGTSNINSGFKKVYLFKMHSGIKEIVAELIIEQKN